jgi:hypothetical protein
MSSSITRIFTLLTCCLLLTAAAGGATVHKVDDSTVTGDVASLADGKLVIKTSSPHPAQVTIPLTDIVQIVWREPSLLPPPPQAQPSGNVGDNQPSGGGFWGMLFGLRPTVGAPAPEAIVPPPPPPPTTQPGIAAHWHIQLTGGDTMHGYITHWSDQKLSIALDSPARQTLDLPTEQLAELWTGTDADQAKAKALSADASTNDVVFVRKQSNVVPVKGVALGIAGDALEFRYGGEDRKISLNRIVGIVMSRGGRKTPAESFRQSVALHNGDTLVGKWISLKNNTAILQTNWGQSLSVSIGDVDRIDCQGGRVVFVSDLKPAKVLQVPFFGRVIPFRLDCGLDGGPLKLSDGIYTKGIAVHSRCVLEYELHGGYTRFRSKVGFEQPSGQIGRAAIRVLADGKPIFANPDARGQDKPASIDCDVTGAQTLTLEVDFGKGDDAGGRVIWANARLLRNMPSQ